MNIEKMYKKSNEIRPQRALVLQGGGALGAYEAGVFKVLYEHLTKQDKGEERPLFDIIASYKVQKISYRSIIYNLYFRSVILLHA